MARRAKPSSTMSTTSVKPVTLNKLQRECLAKLIIKRHKRFPLKKRDIDMIAKTRRREKEINLPTTKEEMEIFTEELNNIEKEMNLALKRLPIILQVTGEDADDDTGIYDDKDDKKSCRNFFMQLENAATGYLADIVLDSKRPNKSEVREGLRLIIDDCNKLEQKLHRLDDYSREFLVNQKIDVDVAINLFGRFKSAYALSQSIDVGKKNQSRTNLCIAIAKALQSIGITVTSSREGLMEEVIAQLVAFTNGTVIQDIQDSIRAAITLLQYDHIKIGGNFTGRL